jgi:hypothetical protein
MPDSRFFEQTRLKTAAAMTMGNENPGFFSLLSDAEHMALMSPCQSGRQ